MAPTLDHAVYYAGVVIAAAAAGVLLAWWLRRRTMVSIRNVYLAALATLAIDIAVIQAQLHQMLLITVPLTAFTIAAGAVGRRWRMSDLGAGEELRVHEQQRRWIWQQRIQRADGETVRIATQGQILRERCWPASESYVPLTAEESGPRVPRRSGRHIFCVGGTGSGKTTSVLRAAAGRALKDDTALFWVDQKGDPPTMQLLRALAAARGVPFILFDPRDEQSDHWQPLWGTRPAEVVARVLAGIEASEPYYADMLRKHVGVVANVLYVGGYWPPSFPLLVEASQLADFDRIVAIADAHKDTDPDLWRRVGHQRRFVESKEGEKALGGGLVRLDLVIGEAWRDVFTPRTATDGERVGVNLAQALRDRAVVLWRTHVDVMPDEAATVTAVILNDIHASAVEAQTEQPVLWTCVLDEFGAVIATASSQALALLQRGRTHEGQVFVVTQSTADIEALTGQIGLLASMADNFLGFIIHRQAAPESRDWLAKLMGTTALWQSTDQTRGYAATGAGSRRRVREFRVSSDTFSELRLGEAVIHTTLGPPPVICAVKQLELLEMWPPRRIGSGARSSCEMAVHPAKEVASAAAPKPVAPAAPDAPDPQRVLAPARARRARRAPTAAPTAANSSSDSAAATTAAAQPAPAGPVTTAPSVAESPDEF